MGSVQLEAGSDTRVSTGLLFSKSVISEVIVLVSTKIDVLVALLASLT